MIKNILIIGGAVVLLGVLSFFLNDSINSTEMKVQKNVSSSALVVDRQLHDFGEIDIFSGVVTTTFALTNEGADDIVVSNGTTSCGCTNAELGGIGFGMHNGMSEEYVIPAGEKRDLTVIYDPLAHGPSGTGLAQRYISLKTNSSISPELEVRIKVMVVKNKQG